jgi:hypothetical protein
MYIENFNQVLFEIWHQFVFYYENKRHPHRYIMNQSINKGLQILRKFHTHINTHTF